jgi:hypothetical protein
MGVLLNTLHICPDCMGKKERRRRQEKDRKERKRGSKQRKRN